MKGLLWKDFYNLKQHGRYMLILVLPCVLIGISAQVYAAIGTCVMMCMVLGNTLFGCDDFSKWDTYALTLPLTKKQIVTARYVVGLLLVVAGVLISLPAVIAALAMGRVEMGALLGGMAGICCIALWILSVLFPFCYRFGVERARIMLVLFCLAPTLLVLALSKMGLQAPSDQTVMLWLNIIGLAAPVVVWFSWKVSCGIYEKKEF